MIYGKVVEINIMSKIVRIHIHINYEIKTREYIYIYIYIYINPNLSFEILNNMNENN